MAIRPERVGADDRPFFDNDVAASVRVKQTALNPAGLVVIDKTVDPDKNINVHAVIQYKPAAGEDTTLLPRSSYFC